MRNWIAQTSVDVGGEEAYNARSTNNNNIRALVNGKSVQIRYSPRYCDWNERDKPLSPSLS